MSSNSFNKRYALIAAQKTLEEIEAEREVLRKKPRGFFARLSTPDMADFHRGYQKTVAEIVYFKATNCTTDVVYLDGGEIQAIKDKW